MKLRLTHRLWAMAAVFMAAFFLAAILGWYAARTNAESHRRVYEASVLTLETLARIDDRVCDARLMADRLRDALFAGVATPDRARRGTASPLEESVFDKVREIGRIFCFQNRMVVNYDTVSLLVVNMPVENDEFCGRIRDHAAMIAEVAEHAMDNITMRNEAIARARELQEMAGMTAEVVETLRQNYRQMQIASRIELEGMVTRIESMYHGLALSTSQEDMISDSVRGASDHVIARLEQGIELDQRFEAIIERLAHSASLPVETPEVVESEIELW